MTVYSARQQHNFYIQFTSSSVTKQLITVVLHKDHCMDEDVLSRNNCIHVVTVDMGLKQLILIPVFCCLKVQLTLFLQTVKIMFLLTQFSPASCYFLSLRLQQLSQHPMPKHPKPSVLTLTWETTFYTHTKGKFIVLYIFTFVF
jgi:hypothetical protein